ncbi:MAG: AMP-binding protein, partial [Pseudolabrys sp.]
MPASSTHDYDALYRGFRWNIPAQYNIGVDCCDRWAARDPGRLVIAHIRPDGREEPFSYGWLRETSNRLANVLRAQGIQRGDRVAILLPQAPEVAAVHIAIYKLAAVALPIAILFGPDALLYRLQNSGAKALITNAPGLAKLAGIRAEAPGLACVLSIDGKTGDLAGSAGSFPDLLAKASTGFTPEITSPDDPAMMIYTSGTTGQPKGALHGHRVLLGHLPGAEMPHFPFPQPGDRYWTPADWAWAGGLLDVLLPCLHHGVPTVARKFDKFDPEDAFALMARAGVRNAFIPPTALRMMRAAPSPRGRYQFNLRTMASGGESLGVEALDWGRA